METEKNNTHGNFVFNTANVEQWLNLLPQFPPWPGTQLHVLAQVALDNLEGQTLFLQFLVFFTGQVTTDPGLQPGHDLAKTFVTELFHLTQDTGTEEYLHLFNILFFFLERTTFARIV